MKIILAMSLHFHGINGDNFNGGNMTIVESERGELFIHTTVICNSCCFKRKYLLQSCRSFSKVSFFLYSLFVYFCGIELLLTLGRYLMTIFLYKYRLCYSYMHHLTLCYFCPDGRIRMIKRSNQE